MKTTMQAADLMEWHLCAEAKDAFERLAEASERVATRESEEGVENLVPADIAPLAEKAAAYAAGNPYITPFHLPDPLAQLGRMAERVRGLERSSARKDAAEIAMECAVLAAFSAMRVERLIERRHWEARLLTAKADAAAARSDFEEEKRLRVEAANLKRTLVGLTQNVENYDGDVRALLSKKQQRAIQQRRVARKVAEEWGVVHRDADLVSLHKAIMEELKKPDCNSEREAIRRCLERGVGGRNMEDFDTVRRGWYRTQEKQAGRGRKQDGKKK